MQTFGFFLPPPPLHSTTLFYFFITPVSIRNVFFKILYVKSGIADNFIYFNGGNSVFILIGAENPTQQNFKTFISETEYIW